MPSAISTSSTAPATVLVVDDVPDNLTLLSGLLKGKYRVKAANRGDRALRIAQGEAPPDLILLDIMMPEMDGYEVVRRLRADPASRDIPVIFITAMTEGENEVKGLEAGAVDYITKPFKPPVVQARVATHLALRRAKRLVELHNEELARERATVEGIVTRMRSHRQFDDRGLRYLVSPVERANGDIFLAARLPDGRQWVLVGDFTGHGLPAAVAAPLVTHLFYAAAAEGGAVEAMMTTLNRALQAQLPAHMFLAVTVVEVAAGRGGARLWRAGTPECLLAGADGGERPLPGGDGLLPFGIVPDLDPVEGAVAFPAAPGDRLFVYTDGITETQAPDGTMFGVERLRDTLPELCAAPSLEPLTQHLDAFRGDRPAHDDLTLVEIGF